MKALLLIVSVVLGQAATTVAPGSWELIQDDPNVRACICGLWVDARRGFDPTERAAWLVRADDGTLSCERWPDTKEDAKQTTKGVPGRAIAILHTHPTRSHYSRSDARVSDNDEKAAKQIKRPIYAISQQIWGYNPATKKLTRHSRTWEEDWGCR